MAFEQNLGQGVAPDVAIVGSRLVVVAGVAPLRLVTMDADTGKNGATVTQPVGYFPKTDGRTVVYHDGAAFYKWVPGYAPFKIPGAPVGNNPTGISPSGICFYQRNQDGQFKLGVYAESVYRGEYRPTGIWECHDDGTFVMMDDARAPWAGGYVHTSGPVSVAEGATGGTLIRYSGLTHILYPGDGECRWPRVAVKDGRAAIVSWGSQGIRLWCGGLHEIASLPPADGIPPVPPVEPPMPDVPNHVATVTVIREKYGKPLGAEHAFAVCNEVAWIHRAEGFGLHRKTSGNNYNGFSVDLVFHRPSGYLVDILGNATIDGNPQWLVGDQGDPNNWVGPTAPTPPTPPVDPPVEPPAPTLEGRVSALELDLLRLKEALAGWIIRD